MTGFLTGLGFDLSTHAGIYWLCFAGIFAFVTFLWVVGNFQRNHSLIDGFYGSMYAVVTIVCFVMTDSNSFYSGLLLLMASLHGFRLGYYLLKRWLGYRKLGSGDARYDGFVQHPLLKSGYWWKSFFVVMHPQTIVIMVIGLPAYWGVMQLSDGSTGLNWLGAIGIFVFGVGTYYEWLADGQLQAFKQDSANKGRYTEFGVWKLSRHPNYFGNVMVWWGIYLTAIAGSMDLWWTIAGPLVNTLMLTKILGTAFQDRHMGGRPEYAQLIKRSSGFLPRFRS
ncbi:MAG: DUF1295 domain-containing protein [Halieaceae bacterium]|nr:DUF1295 domain-containing protein [Halieaceae bacterium]